MLPHWAVFFPWPRRSWHSSGTPNGTCVFFRGYRIPRGAWTGINRHGRGVVPRRGRRSEATNGAGRAPVLPWVFKEQLAPWDTINRHGRGRRPRRGRHSEIPVGGGWSGTPGLASQLLLGLSEGQGRQQFPWPRELGGKAPRSLVVPLRQIATEKRRSSWCSWVQGSRPIAHRSLSDPSAPPEEGERRPGRRRGNGVVPTPEKAKGLLKAPPDRTLLLLLSLS